MLWLASLALAAAYVCRRLVSSKRACHPRRRGARWVDGGRGDVPVRRDALPAARSESAASAPRCACRPRCKRMCDGRDGDVAAHRRTCEARSNSARICCGGRRHTDDLSRWFVNGEKNERVTLCSYGAPSGPAIALYGDSHAAQRFPALEIIAKARGWRLLVVAKTQGATPSVPAVQQNPTHRFYACERCRAAAAESLAVSSAFRVHLERCALGCRSSQGQRFPTVSPQIWEAGLVDLLMRFDRAGVRPIMIRDTPRLRIVRDH